MSLKPRPLQPIPEETVRVARAAFPKGNPYLTLRDEVGTIFEDADFVDLFPNDGQPGYAPWRLALVTLLQFREQLSDRQAAAALAARIDWKYLLGLALTDAGFHYSVLSEFPGALRARLLAGGREALLLEKLLERCRRLGLVKARGQQRTDATRVLAAIRVLNRLELLGETPRAALNELATVAPSWLCQVAPASWYERYSRRIEDDRLPQGEAARTAYACLVGEDGFTLLAAIQAPTAPAALAELRQVQILQQVWARHYERSEGQVRLRPAAALAATTDCIESPYEPDARYRRRYESIWTGYQVHLTETCEADAVHLITHVETTEATVHEAQCTAPIQQALVAKALVPSEHIVDSAHIDAELLVNSQQQHAITLIGPTRPNNSWQARMPGAYDLDCFTIDWEQQQVRCPQGKTSRSWQEGVDNAGGALIYAYFGRRACRPCPVRNLCTHLPARRVSFRPRAQYEALQAARQRQTSTAGQRLYQRRAGIEGTISQGVRAFGLRLCRYRGLAKTIPSDCPAGPNCIAHGQGHGHRSHPSLI